MSEDMLYIHIHADKNGNLCYQAVVLPLCLQVIIPIHKN